MSLPTIVRGQRHPTNLISRMHQLDMMKALASIASVPGDGSGQSLVMVGPCPTKDEEACRHLLLEHTCLDSERYALLWTVK